MIISWFMKKTKFWHLQLLMTNQVKTFKQNPPPPPPPPTIQNGLIYSLAQIHPSPTDCIASKYFTKFACIKFVKLKAQNNWSNIRWNSLAHKKVSFIIFISFGYLSSFLNFILFICPNVGINTYAWSLWLNIPQNKNVIIIFLQIIIYCVPILWGS